MPLTLRSSYSRRDIIIVASIIFLITVVFSFRTVFTEHTPWRRPVGDLPTFGTDKTNPPVIAPPKENDGKHPKPEVVYSSTMSTSSMTSTVTPIPTATPALEAAADCQGFPDTEDILVVMKTGATEAYDKLPIHFLTTLACNNDTILFSDMDMHVAGHHVIDTLDEISEDVMKDNDDFKLYRMLQEYHRLHEDPRELKAGLNGWNLDKYKFIHMLLKSYRYRPDVPWYVFIEADSTIIWDNLRMLLDKFDHNKPLYLGSPTYLDIEFAHGGTGYVISGAAMKKAVGDHLDIAAKYDKDVHSICCGDAMIGRVLLDEQIKLTKVWPMFNGEKPLTFPFGRSHWCQPVITMHHLTAQEVSQVWNFDEERKANGTKTPLIFREIFNYFVKPNLNATRSDWSNLSDDIRYSPPPDDQRDTKTYSGRKWSELSDTERSSPESAENCAKLCEQQEECFQWQHHDKECALHRSIRLGGSKKPIGTTTFSSGWNLKRIKTFEEEAGDCSTGLDWSYRDP